jgi:hypothetical protein
MLQEQPHFYDRHIAMLQTVSKILNRIRFGEGNRIEYVIFYMFLVNIIGNCHENKYI